MPGSTNGRAGGSGGRLALLAPEELDAEQRQTHDALTRLVVPEAEHAGYVAQTNDGRFIGPFNALLRVPRIASGMGQWIGQITAFGFSEKVREAVILTVGAHWGAEFEIYAHIAGARTAGLSEEAITAILDGRPPSGLGPDAAAAQQLTASLVAHHRVPAEIYAGALSAFGEDGIVALLSLIGQYQTISGILVTFEVPTPDQAAAAMTTQIVANSDSAPSMRSVELPAPNTGEARLSVRASGVNPTDYKSLAGLPPGSEPNVLGFEAAGVITVLGPGTQESGLAVGDEVIAYPIFGSYASDVIVPVGDVLRKPRSLDFAQAANLLLAGTTAAEMLEVTGVGGGDTILVHGASSATGVSLMQQAAALGEVRIVATASERNFELVRSFGGEPIAYGPGLEQRVGEIAPGGVDAALDCVGTEEAMQVSLALVADSQRRVTSAGGERAGELGIRFIDGRDPASFAYRNAQRQRLIELAAAGRLTVSIARTFPLSAARDALDAIKSGHPRGKLALLP